MKKYLVAFLCFISVLFMYGEEIEIDLEQDPTEEDRKNNNWERSLLKTVHAFYDTETRILSIEDLSAIEFDIKIFLNGSVIVTGHANPFSIELGDTSGVYFISITTDQYRYTGFLYK